MLPSFRFHKLVTRCYCPSAEVSKRALKAGLKPSQIKVYGLPVRPSFVKPIRLKVSCLFHSVPFKPIKVDLFLLDTILDQLGEPYYLPFNVPDYLLNVGSTPCV